MQEISKTESILYKRYGTSSLTMKQLAKEMQVKHKSLLHMISADRCPVETTGKGRLRRAPIENVANWIDGIKQRASK